ncbi:hypothetical protein BYT27DRAFT_7259234 [Phlegmacium glaucopus]|nr:hypothetical protein BYT27DRAFT_7259234 [Phlegmacium glaucopus]
MVLQVHHQHHPLVVPAVQAPDPPTAANITSRSTCKRPACTLGLIGRNVAFLVPDHVWKKFADGWDNMPSLNYIVIENIDGHDATASKPPSEDNELELSFNE